MTKDLWRARWDAAALANFNGMAARGNPGKSARSGVLSESPFGLTSENRQDFRGLVLREALVRVVADGVDMSFMTLDWAGALRDCEFSHASLDRASLDGRFLGRRFVGCTFKSASLTNGVLYGEFIDCDFTGANLSKGGSGGGPGGRLTFVRCDFTKANFREATLLDCRFDACRFEGARFDMSSMAGSLFARCELPGNYFGDAITDNATIQFT